MEIEKKIAYKNIKCHECGGTIYKPGEEHEAYFCSPNYTRTKRWKLCKACFRTIFSEEIGRKMKNGKG